MVLNCYAEKGQLDDDTRNMLAEVMLNDFLKSDYDKRWAIAGCEHRSSPNSVSLNLEKVALGSPQKALKI